MRLLFVLQDGRPSFLACSGQALDSDLWSQIQDRDRIYRISPFHCVIQTGSRIKKLLLPGTLHGTLTVETIGGQAIFRNLRVTAAGTYRLAAKDGTAKTVSTPFHIIA